MGDHHPRSKYQCLQVEFEAHIWWFRRAHEYCSFTKYEGLAPTRNIFIDDLLFWSNNGYLLYQPLQNKESRFWSSSEPRGPLYEFFKSKNWLDSFFKIKFFIDSLWENYVLDDSGTRKIRTDFLYFFLQRMSQVATHLFGVGDMAMVFLLYKSL